MKNSIKNVLIFVVGAALGSALTWKLLETKYAKLAQEEIDEVREVYRAKMSETEPDKEPSMHEQLMEAAKAFDEGLKKGTESEPTENKVYKEMVKALKYNAGSREDSDEGGDKVVNRPYVISPDQFGEFSDYETLSLTYYADGVIENEYGEILEGDVVEELIGMDSLNHFGEYEDDSVFVRNDELQADYEILMDNNPYPSGPVGE